MTFRRWQLGGLLLTMAMLSLSAAGQSSSPANKPLEVLYFYSPICKKCKKAGQMVRELPSRFPDRVQLRQYDITTLEGQRFLSQYDRRFRNPEPAPKVYFANTVLAGLEEIEAELISAVAAELKKREAPTRPKAAPATSADETGDDEEAEKQSLVKQFETFTWFSMWIAGLLDGINPCAFTTMVFIVSMLSFLGKRRKEVLQIGLGFVLGVFIAYFLLGVGALFAIKAAAVHAGLFAWLAWAVAILAFGLAGWSLWDALRIIRTGRPEAATLGLPEKTVKRIHTLIRNRLSTGGMFIGAFILGVGISLLESVCTGQVYIPVIMLIIRVSKDHRLQACGYLLVYNVAFILPLAVVLGMAAWGMGSQKIASFFRRHIVVVKLLMAGLFIFLGLAVIWSL